MFTDPFPGRARPFPVILSVETLFVRKGDGGCALGLTVFNVYIRHDRE